MVTVEKSESIRWELRFEGALQMEDLPGEPIGE